MELEEKQIKRLKQLLTLLEPDAITKQDFIAQFEKIIAFVKQIAEKNVAEMEMMKRMVSQMSEQMKNGNIQDMNAMKEKMMSYCENEMAKMQKECDTMMAEHDMKMAEMDMKMSEVQNGKDADEQMMIDTVIEKVQKPVIDKLENELPQLGEKIRDGLEILQGDERLDKSAIKGLEELIKELEDKISQSRRLGGGFSKIAMDSHYIDNEVVSGSGTTFTLANTPNPATSLRLYGYGQRLTSGTNNDYIISGRIITTINSFSAGAILADYKI